MHLKARDGLEPGRWVSVSSSFSLRTWSDVSPPNSLRPVYYVTSVTPIARIQGAVRRRRPRGMGRGRTGPGRAQSARQSEARRKAACLRDGAAPTAAIFAIPPP